MHWLQLQVHSIPYFTQFLLALSITIFLLKSSPRRSDAAYLTLFFGSYTAFFLNLFLANSIVDGWRFYFPALHPIFFILTASSFLHFAYAFLEDPYPRESRLLYLLSRTAVAGVTLYCVTELLTRGPAIRIQMRIFVVAFALLLAWSFVVLLRKTLYFSRRQKRPDLETEPPREPVPRPSFGRRWSLPRWFVVRGDAARAHRDFALTIAWLVFVGAVSATCVLSGFLSTNEVQYLSSPGILIFLSGCALAYFNNTPEEISFQAKLVGLSLVTMLAVLGILSLGIYSHSELTREGGAALPEHESIRFSPDGRGGYSTARKSQSLDSDLGERLDLGDEESVRLSLDFEFPFFEKRWHEIFVSSNGMVTLGGASHLEFSDIYRGAPVYYSRFYDALPKIAPLFLDLDPAAGGGVFCRRDPRRVVLTWWRVPKWGTDSQNTIRLALHRDGTIDFEYGAIEARHALDSIEGVRGLHPGGAGRRLEPDQLSALESGLRAGPAGLIEDYRLAHRRSVHSRVSKLAYMILATTAFILILFPLFFRSTLINPLNALLTGVTRVNRGHLDVHVPIRFNDEIGDLSRNFNAMTDSLKSGEEQLKSYAENLEEMVAERTFALERSLKELKDTQSQLIQAEKLASMGRLTAGIAHELRNPLNFIKNFSEVSSELARELLAALKPKDSDETPDPDDVEDLATDIAENVDRVLDHSQTAELLVRKMMDHSAEPPTERTARDLNGLLKDCVDVVEHRSRQRAPGLDVGIDTNFDPEIGTVTVRDREMGQVFRNLLDNAFEAVAERAHELPAGFDPMVSVSTQKLEDGIEIRIQDNGGGVPEDIRERIFEPFFTTKPISGGNVGLGLWLCYDIVVQGHQGRLDLENEEGETATWVVFLPA